MLERGRRWVGDQWPFLVVSVTVLAGFGYLLVQPGHWVRGTALMGGAAVVAGALRLFLPVRRIGLLAARSRLIDTVLYVAVGFLVLGVDLRLSRA